jgi:threonine/homoserine/homoserine lactone efflux protein
MFAAFPLGLACGFVGGFVGAIPPGPIGITCLRRSLLGERRQAYHVALGGASVDVLTCALVGFGVGWVLERVVTSPWVRGPLALFLVASGVKLLLDARSSGNAGDGTGERVPSAPPRGTAIAGMPGLPFLTGFLQGASNPGPFVNWTLFISFLIGHRLLDPSPAGAGGFAVGVGLGVFSWFSLLIRAAHRLRDHSGPWVARSTVVAGAFLLATGLYFGWRSLASS